MSSLLSFLSPHTQIRITLFHGVQISIQLENVNMKKTRIIESRLMQVRTTHECDTQLLYDTSGPTVSEDDTDVHALDTVQ